METSSVRARLSLKSKPVQVVVETPRDKGYTYRHVCRSELLKMNYLNKLALVAAFAIGGMDAAYAQNAVEQLQPLVETTAHRLMTGEQVALAKWDSGKAVEDAPREAQVIRDAMKDGAAKALDEASVSNFFKAQIEANKFVQYALLADWYRAGKAPEHAPVDLLKVIRPQLDEAQKSLIAELVDTASVRTSKTCRADVAKAVGKYVSTHALGGGPITAATLDRALAGACTS
jgi:chorismate mutase